MKKTVKQSINEQWKMGFDPEFFIGDIHGNILNAIPILKQDKYNPIIISPPETKVYYDCTNLEHTTPVSGSKQEVITNFRNIFNNIQNKVLGQNYRLVSKAAHKFEKSQLESKESWEIGCSSSFDIYRSEIAPNQEFTDETRTTAGHIHMSRNDLEDFDIREKTVKLLDAIVGTSLVIIGHDETSAARRKLYGKAGNFRFEKTRLEWRVPDSYYLRSPETTELVYDLIDYTLSLNGDGDKILNLTNPAQVQKAINECHKGISATILNKINLPKNLFDRVNKDYSQVNLYKDWNINIDNNLQNEIDKIKNLKYKRFNKEKILKVVS